MIGTGTCLLGLLTAVSAEQGFFDKNKPIKNPKKLLEQKVDKKTQAAGQLIGETVYGTRGQELGEIEEILLTADLQKISKIVLSSGGILGLGEKLTALPLKSITFNQEKTRLEADLFLEALKKLPDFSMENQKAEQRLGTLQGKPVHLRNEKAIGNLITVTVSLKHNELSLAILDGEVFDSLRGKTVVIPWSSISVSDSGRLTVDAELEQIEAVAFEQTKLPHLGDRRFGAHVYRRFGMEPFWPTRETDTAWRSGGYYGYWPYRVPGVYYYY
jgi:sporulation protein YlmC with PRC-barrel domain